MQYWFKIFGKSLSLWPLKKEHANTLKGDSVAEYEGEGLLKIDHGRWASGSLLL